LEASLSGHLSPQTLTQLKDFLKQGTDVPPLFPYAPIGTSNTTEQQQSIEIATPITSLTPLQYSFGNPNSEIVFVGDLTPISQEEMPPSDLFFS